MKVGRERLDEGTPKPPQRIGTIGAELLVKAALCAAMIALLAGLAAAFLAE